MQILRACLSQAFVTQDSAYRTLNFTVYTILDTRQCIININFIISVKGIFEDFLILCFESVIIDIQHFSRSWNKCIKFCSYKEIWERFLSLGLTNCSIRRNKVWKRIRCSRKSFLWEKIVHKIRSCHWICWFRRESKIAISCNISLPFRKWCLWKSFCQNKPSSCDFSSAFFGFFNLTNDARKSNNHPDFPSYKWIKRRKSRLIIFLLEGIGSVSCSLAYWS